MSENEPLDPLTPAARTIGKEILSIEAASGSAQLRFVARPEFANRHGSVGGGFLAAMLDSTTATSVLAGLAPGLTAVTRELHVSFLAPAPLGELYGHGRRKALGEREAEAEAELSTAAGTLVARATARFRIIGRAAPEG